MHKDFKIKEHCVIWYFSYAGAISIAVCFIQKCGTVVKKRSDINQEGPCSKFKNVKQRKLSFVRF